MGIRGLTSLIKKYVPEALQNHNLQYYNGSRIAIDTSILLYKFRYANNGKNSHISGFLNKCLNYVRHGIIPIFIIDGKPPPEKSETIRKRHNHRQKIETKIETLRKKILSGEEPKSEGIEKLAKLDRQVINVTREHHKETQELLRILGFHVIQSPGEAEEVCAYLQKNGIVNFTYSDDTDLLALGCSRVLRSNGTSNSLTEIDLGKVLDGLELTLDQFIDLCILCGCDYCNNIPKINYQKAYEMIKTNGSIENCDIPADFNYQRARDVFKNSYSKLCESPKLGESPKLDELRLYKFLKERKYNRNYIGRYIEKFNTHVQFGSFEREDNNNIKRYFKMC